MKRIPTLFKQLSDHPHLWGIALILVAAYATADMELAGSVIQGTGNNNELARTTLQQGDYAQALTDAREAVARTCTTGRW